MQYAEHSIYYTCLHVEWDEYCIDSLYWCFTVTHHHSHPQQCRPVLILTTTIIICFNLMGSKNAYMPCPANTDCHCNIHLIQHVNMLTYILCSAYCIIIYGIPYFITTMFIAY